MYHDEPNRGNPNLLTRRTIPNKNRSYQQNQGYQAHGGGYNNPQGRRPNNGSSNLTINNGGRQFNPIDRVMRQNDIIIKLLTEIRSRLPAPPRNEQYTQNGASAVNPTAEFPAQETAREESVSETSVQEETREENGAEAYTQEAVHEENGAEANGLANAQEKSAEVNSQARERQEEDNFNR